MKYLLILFFCFGHFTSYGNNKKVTEDSKATSKLQDNIKHIRYLKNVDEIIKEKTDQYAKLQNQIKKTKDEANCKALKVQIGELSKQIKTFGEDHQIIVDLTQLLGSCSKTGYVSHVTEKIDQYAKLQNQIERTKDEASCKALKV